jgi:hypothetical protein
VSWRTISVTNRRIEAAAIDVFQREVGAAVLFADLVDLDDVEVETGRRLTRRK